MRQKHLTNFLQNYRLTFQQFVFIEFMLFSYWPSRLIPIVVKSANHIVIFYIIAYIVDCTANL